MKSLSEMTLKELWELFPIVLAEHNPNWKDWYTCEAAVLSELLPFPVCFYHIGSTAIPGIFAKPIVDILAEVSTEEILTRAVRLLQDNGYLLMNASSTRASLNKGYTPAGFAEQVFHIHLRLTGDHNELYFRDYLLSHPEAAKEYEALKLSLWKDLEHDRDRYTAAKSDMVAKFTRLGRDTLLKTHRFILRPWRENDAEDLYRYASDPDVGYPAGWPAHTSVENSLRIIQTVFSLPECFAICRKEDDRPIGAISLKLGASTDMTERPDECELGYWIGKPFWGRGVVPEAGEVILEHAFHRLGMQTVWCGHYEGNTKSRRVMEKLGFTYIGRSEGLMVPLLDEIRTGHLLRLTRKDWESRYCK